MKYVEMTVEDAIKVCNKNAKVLVAIQDLADKDCNLIFIKKKRGEYLEIFQDVKTVVSAKDDFIEQLRLFTEKQNILCISPKGFQKTILLKQLE